MTETLTGHALSDMLASWLPRQRWFPGGGRSAGELEIISDEVLLDGDPQLRHLIVEAGQVGMQARFQVLLGCRSQLPATVTGAAVIGQLPGMTCYDALHDPDLAMVLLRGIAHERTAGPLRFVREPAAPLRDWQVEPAADRRAEQHQPGLRRGGDPQGAATAVPRRQPRPGGRRRPRPARLGPGRRAVRLDRDPDRRRAGAAGRAVGVPRPRQRRLEAGDADTRPPLRPTGRVRPGVPDRTGPGQRR